jgi:hypothetical protein
VRDLALGGHCAAVGQGADGGEVALGDQRAITVHEVAAAVRIPGAGLLVERIERNLDAVRARVHVHDDAPGVRRDRHAHRGGRRERGHRVPAVVGERYRGEYAGDQHGAVALLEATGEGVGLRHRVEHRGRPAESFGQAL